MKSLTHFNYCNTWLLRELKRDGKLHAAYIYVIPTDTERNAIERGQYEKDSTRSVWWNFSHSAFSDSELL